MAYNSEDIYSPESCINYANELIQLCDLPFPAISSLKDIDSKFIITLFESITQITVPDLLVSDDSVGEAHNIQAVIDTLSLDFLKLSLSHITGDDIVSGNVVSIHYLLEVFEAVFLHLPSKSEDEVSKISDENINPDSSSLDEKTVQVTPVVRNILASASTETEENSLPPRVLKRKTCKNTLKKSRQSYQVPEKKRKPEQNLDAVDHAFLPSKRKISKPVQGAVKQPLSEGIEKLYQSNFEKKVQTLLQGQPVLQAQRMQRKYIQSLKMPLKRTTFLPCKKSFLLPHNLRFKSKSPRRQHPAKRKTSPKKSGIKPLPSKSLTTDDKNTEIPTAIKGLLSEFPGFKFPKSSLDRLTKHYYHHMSFMHKQLKSALLKKPSTMTQTEKAMDEEAKLSKILDKDVQCKDRLRELHEHRALENKIKSSLRDAKIRSIKMRQYFDEFHKSMSKKLQKRNYSEEVLVEKTFKEILNIQKEKVRLLCKRVKATNDQDAEQHRIYLDAMKNLYEQQLDLLAESVQAEHKASSEREKAQKLAAEKLHREIVRTLQKDVRSLQRDVLEMIEDIHFRELDAQNFIRSSLQQDL